MNKVIFCGMMPVLLLFFSRKYIKGIYPDNALFHQLTHNQLSNKPSSLLMKIKPTHELDKFTGRLIYKIDL